MAQYATVTENELSKLFDDTKKTKFALNIFTKYLSEKKMNQPHDKDTLAEALKMFYIEARKENGSAYSKISLNNIRLDLNRHFLSTHDININNPAFRDAKKALVQNVCSLNDEVSSKLPIET